MKKKCIHEKNRVFKSAIKQMCLVRSIDIHPTWREAWRRASVAIVSRNTDIHRLCSQTDSWRKSSLPRNISTLEAMLLWTKEKSISLFGCWNAQKSLQKKCHRGGGETQFSFPELKQKVCTCITRAFPEVQQCHKLGQVYFIFRLLYCVETVS